ncbi:MAG: KOW motif-containing protein, partial [Bacteroidales bacterium]|nr:KOW motif-containing protein [Bacteroidales bacterium]
SAKLENIIRNLVPGMSGFLTEKKTTTGAQFERIPVPIREEEAQRILGVQDENVDSAAETLVNYEIGESVRITDGPFSGFSGVVDEILEDRSKVKVIVVIFGRKTQLELSFTQVTKE